MRRNNNNNGTTAKRNCKTCRDKCWLIECQCDAHCGLIRSLRDNQGTLRTHIKGHNTLGRKLAKGPKSNGWKGGRIQDPRGYIHIYTPDHPNADKQGYMLEHRFVYEKSFKCCLLNWVVVHHINEDP